MNCLKLTLSHIEGSPFRSWLIFFSALMLSGLAIGTTLIVRGAQDSLEMALNRLGADIIVVPAGSEEGMENAFLMGVTLRIWMDEKVLDDVKSLPGVEAASPQIYLSTLRGAVCCAVPDLFLVAYDPETDFTLHPWLQNHLPNGLSAGNAIGGSLIFIPDGGDSIAIYGYGVGLQGNLEPTGTNIDQSMFFTMDTAQKIAETSITKAEQRLDIPVGKISAVMVKVGLDADPKQVATAIRQNIPGVSAVESSNLFTTHRANISSLLDYLVVVLGVVWLLSIALVALLFSMTVNERRREIAVMRALGAVQSDVLGLLLSEASFLALAGGVLGAGLFSAGIYLARNVIIDTMGFPFLFPSWAGLLGVVLLGLSVSLITVLLSAIGPVLRISRMEPAEAMRE